MLSPRIVVLGALLLLSAAKVHAAPPANIIAPQAEQFSLDNGMQVVVVPDHRAPVVTHMVWYKIGAADEARGKSGIAHFLEHLMFKGTTKNPAGKFSQWLATIGGQENAFTSYDYTAYFQRTTKNYLPQLMEFESDRMSGLVLSDENVLPERDVIMEERRQVVEQRPEAILSEAMDAALYQNHPYGTPIIGWLPEMKLLSTQDALDFYGRFYTPNNATLVVAGDVTTDEVRKLAEATYGKVLRRAEPPKRQRPGEPPQRAARSVTFADQRVKQEGWTRQYFAPSYAGEGREDAPALEMLEEIMGGTTGRIYQRLVLEKKIAAMATANYDGRGLDNGTFSFGVTPRSAADFPVIEKEIDALVQDIITNNVKPEELERARSSLLATTIYAEDSQTYLANLFGAGLTVGLSFDEIRQRPQKFAAVTVDDIRKVARTWLKKEGSVTGYLIQEQAGPAPKPDAKVQK